MNVLLALLLTVATALMGIILAVGAFAATYFLTSGCMWVIRIIERKLHNGKS